MVSTFSVLLDVVSPGFVYQIQILREQRPILPHHRRWAFLREPSCLFAFVGENCFTLWAVFCYFSFATWEIVSKQRKGCSWLVLIQRSPTLTVLKQGKLVPADFQSLRVCLSIMTSHTFLIKFRFPFYTFKDFHTLLCIYSLAFMLLFKPLPLP